MRYVIEGLVIALVVIFVLTRDGNDRDCMKHLEQASIEVAHIADYAEQTRDVDVTISLLRGQSHRLALLTEKH